MKLNTLTAAIIAASAAAITSASAFADDSAQFEAQLAVTSVNACNFTVTPENGTAMTATYKYTAADQTAGTFGTTTLDTTEPLTVLVSSGSDTCPLGQFTVATSNPGIKIAKNTAGIPTHDGGVWPVVWYYTQFDSYTDQAANTASEAGTEITTTTSAPIPMTSVAETNPPGPPVDGWHVIASTQPNQLYGSYEGGRVPALSTASKGGHLTSGGKLVDVDSTTSSIKPYYRGMAAVSGVNDAPTSPAVYSITPSPDARSVVVGLAQVLATFPYGKATQTPDPLTVFDTASGGGVPITGTGTMTITPL